MRANDATGRITTERSGRRCIVVLGVLEGERNKENVENEGKERV